MTAHKSFKRLVRTRMDKTGESYTAARAALLGPKPAGATVLATSDATIRERTIAAPVEEVYAALTGGLADLTYRSGTAPRSAHYDTPDGTSRVHVTLAAVGGRTKVSVEQARLADAPAADKAKAYWREHLGTLKTTLEGQH